MIAPAVRWYDRGESARRGQNNGDGTIDDDLAAILDREEEPIEHVALEMIVLELYRRGTISSGKAAALLGVCRDEFFQRASAVGIPNIDMSKEELAVDMAASNSVGAAESGH